MLIYVFVEHYPNPYKPYFDTQFAHFTRIGHEVAIFAGGKYVDTVNDDVRRYELDRKTSYCPTTLKTLPLFFGKILSRCLFAPRLSLRRAVAVYERDRSLKENMLRVARMLVLPERAPDLCLIHNLATAAGFDFLAQIYPHSRVVMYFHGGEVGGVRRVTQEAQIFARMHSVYTNTEFSRRQAIDRGCAPERANVVPVGFDLSHYVPDQGKRYCMDGVLRLISIGRLGEEKGYRYVIDAVAELVAEGRRDLHYTIVGGGQQQSLLQQLVQQRGLSAYVGFAGEQDRRGVVEQLRRADVLILPSVVTDTWAETQACVVQEAMLMRLPVITTQTGGVPESIAEVMRPFAVPCGDAGAIASAVRKIAALTESELAQMGEAGRRFVADKYDIEKTNRTLLALALDQRVGDDSAVSAKRAAMAEGG